MPSFPTVPWSVPPYWYALSCALAGVELWQEAAEDHNRAVESFRHGPMSGENRFSLQWNLCLNGLLLRFDQDERVGLEADLLSPMAPAPDRYTSMWVRLLLGRLCLKCAAAHGGWLHHRADAEALLRSSAPVAGET